MEQQKLAFGERAPEQAKISKGLKIGNNGSKYTQENVEKQNFEEQADDFIATKKARNKKAVELASKFISLLKDKTLPENKTTMAKDVELELCGNLVKLTLELNADESEPEGMGSAALINVLLKTTLLQRDIVNSLEFRLNQIEKQLSSQQNK